MHLFPKLLHNDYTCYRVFLGLGIVYSYDFSCRDNPHSVIPRQQTTFCHENIFGRRTASENNLHEYIYT